MQIRPSYLKKGDKIGISAPARWIDPGDLDFFLGIMEREGYRPVIGSVFTHHHQFAGDDLERQNDLQAMMDDPDIRAIFCARGGYGSVRILNQINTDGFARHPKWLTGFSDITVLHSLLWTQLRCESLHACMPFTMKDFSDLNNPGISSLLAALKGEMPAHTAAPCALNRPGAAEGILLGGNLSVLCSLTGTPWHLDTQGAVLFLEDVDEYLYHIDRMMLNLKMAGMLSGLAGLVIGGMTDMKENAVPFGKDANQIIREAVEEYDYPVCLNFPAGHKDPNLALVLGRKAKLHVDDTGCRLTTLIS